MKQLTVLIAIVALASTANVAYAAGYSAQGHSPSWNLDIFAGKQDSDTLKWDSGKSDTDSGRSQGIGISKQLGSRTAVGFEVGYTKNKFSDFKPDYISGTSAMLTTKYDFARYGRFQAYAGFGLGLVRVKYKNHAGNYELKDTVEAGQLTLGARMAVSKRAKIFIEARHVDAFSDPKVVHDGTGSLKGAEYNGDSLVLGLRYSF